MYVRTVRNTIELLCCRRELFHLQRELLRERTRNSVLEEQLKPINIHRWRRLEVTDLFNSVCVDLLEALPVCICLLLPHSDMNIFTISLFKQSKPHYSKRKRSGHLHHVNDSPLQGSDPGKYELIQKIQSLQKRLIAKTQELEERELLLQVNTLSSMCTHKHTHSLYMN